jgi:UPF0755 protein
VTRRRRRRQGERLRHTAGFIGAAVSTALVAGCLLWFFGPVTRQAHPIEVPEGASLRQIGHQLEQDRVIHSARAFELVGRLMGAERELRAGKFLIPALSAPHQIIGLLVHGPMMANVVTLPEGLTLWEVAGILAAEAEVDSAQFAAAASDSLVAARFGISQSTLEGYLYPDTYDVPVGMPVADVLALLVGRSQSVLQSVVAGRPIPAPLRADTAQVMVLASIVEAEARVPVERPQIAAVYLNRLRLGMRLEADPTVAYALRARRRLYFKDLEVDSPWNTYKTAGLPPTAICNPGRSSIEAVMAAGAAPPTEDLYFVARGDGTHVFSRTYEEHERACLRFRSAAGTGRREGEGLGDSLRSGLPGPAPAAAPRPL